MTFLLDSHDRVIAEQEGPAFAKSIGEIRDLAHRLRTRYASADEKKLVGKFGRLKVVELLDVSARQGAHVAKEHKLGEAAKAPKQVIIRATGAEFS